MVDLQKAQQAIILLLQAIGEDPTREGLVDTPLRVSRMYEELTQGYEQDIRKHLSVTFYSGNNDLVLEKDIEFHSICEHHLAPFFGKVHVAYIPNGKVVGLSKLARVIEGFARRLQIQEQMTAQIADAIYTGLDCLGVMIMLEATHTCITMRGIKKVGTKTVTVATRGVLKENLDMQKNIQDLMK